MPSTRYHLIHQALSVLRAEGIAAFVEKLCLVAGMKMLGTEFYQRPVIDCIQRNSNANGTFIDIGASTGDIAIAAASSFKYCAAIEPSSHNLAILREKVKGLRNCTVYHLALSNAAGSIELDLSRTNKDDNIVWGHRADGVSEKVEVTTLDEFIQRIGLPEPFVIKLDVQGWELQVLKGAERTLTQDVKVISEFCPFMLRLSGSGALEYLDFLDKHNFIPYDLKGHRYPHEKLTRISEQGKFDEFVVVDLFLKRE